jgi:hypothetical protein
MNPQEIREAKQADMVSGVVSIAGCQRNWGGRGCGVKNVSMCVREEREISPIKSSSA